MDINPTAVEQMAREYNRTLGALTASDDSGIYEQATILEEEQLDLLNEINVRSSNRLNRTVSYLKNVVFRSLAAINRANGNPSYIPSVRTQNVACSPSSIMNRLMNLQLDIFIILDKLSAPYADRAELLMLENRKAALLASML